MLSGDDFREQANDNRVREVRQQAPRGDVVDRNGKCLPRREQDRAGLYVQPRDLPKPGTDERSAVTQRLERVTGEAHGDQAEIARARSRCRAR